MRSKVISVVVAVALLALVAVGSQAREQTVEPDVRAYADLLREVVRGDRVDYQALAAVRPQLAQALSGFDDVAARGEAGWPRESRIAFWINAYNAFTLKAIVDHYPIRAGWFTRQPRNSIRQIDGVWTTLRWPAAGRMLTLDDIEHRILRPEFGDARVHFAINCASVSCPPLADQPYRAADLNAQLDAAARRYLASPLGLQVDARTLRVSSIFDWYGDDFVREFADKVPGSRAAEERAILGTVIAFGPSDAAALAREPDVRISFLPYDWALNDASKIGGP